MNPRLAIEIKIPGYNRHPENVERILTDLFVYGYCPLDFDDFRYAEEESTPKGINKPYAWLGENNGLRLLVIDGDSVKRLPNRLVEEFDVVVSLSCKSKSQVIEAFSRLGVPTLSFKASNFTELGGRQVFDHGAFSHFMQLKIGSDNDRSPAYDIGVGTIIGLINILLQMLIR